MFKKKINTVLLAGGVAAIAATLLSTQADSEPSASHSEREQQGLKHPGQAQTKAAGKGHRIHTQMHHGGAGRVNEIASKLANAAAEDESAELENKPKEELTRTERVRLALDRLRETSAGISEESLKKEQLALASAREKAYSREAPRPSISDYKDDQGLHWNRLTYEDGHVRYEIPQDPINGDFGKTNKK